MTIAKAPPVEKLCAYLGCQPTEFDEAYRRLRRKLVKFFNWKRCPEASELADETVARVLEAIERERDILDFSNFVLGVARKLFVDWTRGQVKVDALRRGLEIDLDLEWLPPSSSDEAQCLERCLGMLPPDRREFIEACFVDKRRTELRRTLQLSSNAMRMRIFHSKQRLRSCVGACVKARNTGRV
jgi:DNA-directed RNA polymerase specialized sigma24 family protein